jgi:aminoglycoside phosphotransferase family enzyme/predicted kinase
MSDPGFYPHPVSGPESIETHISRVFLTGKYVYKLKKAVTLDFLDYSTLEKRKLLCIQEVRLNRRLAPGVYIAVVPITRSGERFFLDGPGKPVEYAVKMRQLRQESSLLQVLRHPNSDQDVIDALARRLSSFYRAAASGPAIDAYGAIKVIRANCEENFRQLNGVSAEINEEGRFEAVQAATRAFLLRNRALFQDRVKRGKIRDCHGDLRSDHIHVEDGLQIIDCIEFNDRFRYSDIACDLAFLIMDLEYNGFTQAARNFIDAYVRYSKDAGIYPLLDFYKCYRAAVRSKVAYLMLQGLPADGTYTAGLKRDIKKYLSLALRYAVCFTRPTIYVLCGLPASGKSTIAKELCATLHVAVLRSDRVRKHLFNIPPGATVDVPIEKGIYSPGATSLTYGRLFLLAQESIEKGKSIILDATFSREHQRREAFQLARDLDANILFIECWAPPAVLKKRLQRRQGSASLSDARSHHLSGLRSKYKPFDAVDSRFYMRIDTQADLAENIQEILSHDYSLLCAIDAAGD